MIDAWRDILEDLARHGFRTVLTAVSVGWGVMMLVLLQGFGVGLENNVEHEFRDDAVNSIWVYRGEASMPYKGHAVGRSISLDMGDYAAVRDVIPGVEYISARFYLWGDFTIAYGDRASAFSVRSCHPDHLFIEKTIIEKGRFLNELDIQDKRKVVVIGDEVERFLFRGKDPLGEFIDIKGIRYRVVGVFRDEGSEGEAQQVYIPITTAQAAYGGGDRIHQLMFTIGDADLETSMAIEEQLRALLAERKRFDVRDQRAVRIRNNVERFQEFMAVFEYIRSFLWMVGLGTLGAGIVSVSNIMLVSVRERTAEIGLRKALGASPASLVGRIVAESLLLTSVSGYAGLVAGVAALELASGLLGDNAYVREPQVDLGVALVATGIIVVAGGLAGFFPALRAAAINPVDALRDA